MESVLTKNINALRKNYPGLAETIEKMCLEAEDTASDYIIIEYTKTNQINFRIDYEDKSILLHSAYDPNKEAEKWIEKYDLKYKDSLAILGVGAGYHIEALVRKYPNKNKIIIEPNKELFIKLIKNSDVSDILKADNTLFIVSDNSEEIAKYFLGLRLGGQIDNIEFMELISYERLYRDWWQNFKQEFIKYTKLYQINLHTSVLFKKEWFLNFCENAKVFSESVTFDNYKDVFKDIPAIIVSAGPSLNKNIELLKNIKDKAIIISCGSAINILESRGIVPHVMAGIDPGKDQSKIFGSVKSQDIFF
ncbi:MAG: motility associated factor glycosyltransferase family protein, partial [Bacillota bacterium]